MEIEVIIKNYPSNYQNKSSLLKSDQKGCENRKPLLKLYQNKRNEDIFLNYGHKLEELIKIWWY